MANGFPISAIVGQREMMRVFEDIFFSFTFGGETMSLAASKATITEMQEKNVVQHLWEQGVRLKDGYNVLAREFGVHRYTECLGFPPRTVVLFRDDEGADSLPLKSLFQQECLKRGVLFTGGHNINFSHSSSDIDQTLRVYRAAMEIAADAVRKNKVLESIEGELVRPIFRRA